MTRKNPLEQLKRRFHGSHTKAVSAVPVVRPNPLGVRADELVVFAYGSNLLTARIHDRAPGARPVGIARLDRFVLKWNKRSKDGSAKCSIEETGQLEHFVWGVLYALNTADKKALDSAEGLGAGYGERSVNVISSGHNLPVLAYYATSVDLGLKPYDWYRELVIAGAREHSLPADYIAALDAVPTMTDLNDDRAARERQYLPQSKATQRVD